MAKKKFFIPTYFGLLAGAVSAYFLFKKGDDLVDTFLPADFQTKMAMLGGTATERELAAEDFLGNIEGIQMDIAYSDEARVVTILSDSVLSTQDVQFSKGPVDVTIQASTRIL